MTKLTRNILIKSMDADAFIDKCNKINEKYNVYATQYKPMMTENGIMWTALLFIEVKNER